MANATADRRELVMAAFETMLGREPESEAAIRGHLDASSSADVIRIIGGSTEFRQRHIKGSVFDFFNASVDAMNILARYTRTGIEASPDHFTNFLGVKIRPAFVPHVLEGRAGLVEGPPVPANWHADMAEWAGVLRAVDLARGRFVMAELGCGWGCWMNNTAAAARIVGLEPFVIGVEGDKGHIEFAKTALRENGVAELQYALYHGVAGAATGTVLFPRQDAPGSHWGLEPVFDASKEERAKALATGSHSELPQIGLKDICEKHGSLDLLHVDIQGGELQLLQSSINILSKNVSYMVIGTHSRAIEGSLIDLLNGHGWVLEIERPAVFMLNGGTLHTTIDGVQAWRNARLEA